MSSGPAFNAMQSIRASRAGGDTKQILMVVLVVALIAALLFWPDCAGLCLFQITKDKVASGVKLGSVAKTTVGACGLKALATKSATAFSWMPSKAKSLTGPCTILGNPTIGATTPGAVVGIKRK